MRIIKKLFSFLFYFPIWWYVKNLRFWFLFISRALRLLADGLAIFPFLRHFFAPYREDRTFVGYGLGIVTRTLWLTASTAILLASAAFLLIVFVLYLVWPLTFLVALMEILEGYPEPAAMWGFLFLPAVWVYYQGYVRRPKKKVERIKRVEKIEEAMTAAARRLWRKFKSKYFKPDLTIGDISDFVKMLFAAPKIKDIFLRLDFDKSEQDSFLQKLGQLRTVSIKSDLDGLAENILQTAREFQHEYIDEDIIFLSLVATIPQLEQILKQEGITIEAINDTISWVEDKADARESWKFWQDRHFHLRGGVDLAFVAGFIPTLKHFSLDISKLIKQGKIPRIVGREAEVEEILQALSRTTQGNVLLVGPPGVGKTSIIYAIAQRLLSEKKIIQLDLAGIIGGTAGRGDLEWRVQKTIQEAGKGRAILFIDEIEGLVAAGLSDYFSPTLSTGDIQIIGTTTREDYKNLISPQPLFTTYFQVVEISEPNDDEAIKILQGITEEIEKEQEVTITYPAIEAAVKLSRRYIHDRVLPDKAVDLLDATAVSVAKTAAKGKPVGFPFLTRRVEEPASPAGRLAAVMNVTDEDVAIVLSQQIGVPVSKITLEESEKLLNLEEILHERIIGQKQAITAISNAMRRTRAGLTPGNRPIASFLFLGPTGVGKTETTKALSQAYFGTEENMIRFDMSEFSESGLVANFTARLCDEVSRTPFTVILLDEIEKAIPEIHNLLLQVLDEGRLTDHTGKEADFTNTMVIGTSNVYQKGLKGMKGVKDEEIEVRRVLEKFFRPELINRFDGLIVFEALTPSQMIEIAKLELAKVIRRLEEKQIEISFSDAVSAQLAKEGYDPEFGARPLRRVIMEKIENPVSKKILSGRMKIGQKLVVERLPIV